MIKLGRAEGNRMVNMQITNAKLRGLRTRMIAEAAGIGEEQAREPLPQLGIGQGGALQYRKVNRRRIWRCLFEREIGPSVKRWPVCSWSRSSSSVPKPT